MRRINIPVLLITGSLCAAQPSDGRNAAVKGSGEVMPVTLPIATVSSSKGLIVNGVRTPQGVSSAILVMGDTIQTFDVPATVRYRDGRTATLAPVTTYQLPGRTGGSLAPTGTRPRNLRAGFSLPPVSVRKP
jgi:hypothetical protein